VRFAQHKRVRCCGMGFHECTSYKGSEHRSVPLRNRAVPVRRREMPGDAAAGAAFRSVQCVQEVDCVQPGAGPHAARM